MEEEGGERGEDITLFGMGEIASCCTFPTSHCELSSRLYTNTSGSACGREVAHQVD